jgi:putative FmdB family regulatory protein
MLFERGRSWSVTIDTANREGIQVPLFEYQCRDCETRFEVLVFRREEETKCRNCGSTKVSQLLSTFAVAGTSDRAPEPGPCGGCSAAQRGTCGMN